METTVTEVKDESGIVMPKLDTSRGFEKLDYMVKHGRKPGDGKGPIKYKKGKKW